MTTPHKFMRIFTFFFFCFTQVLYANQANKICQVLYPANYDYNDALRQLNILSSPSELSTFKELNKRLSNCKKGSYEYVHLDFVKHMYYRRTKQVELADSIAEYYLYNSDITHCTHIENVINSYVFHLSGNNRYKKLIDIIHLLEKRKFGLTDAFVYERLASLYFHLKRYEQAAEHFVMLLEIGKKKSKDRSSCYNNLALCYENIGDKERAKQAYQKALEYWDKGNFRTDFQRAYYTYFRKIIENNLITLDLEKGGEYKDSIMYNILQEEYQLSFIEGRSQDGVGLLFQLAEYGFKVGDFNNAIKFTNQIIKETHNGKTVPQERLGIYHMLLSQKFGLEGQIDEMIKQGNQVNVALQNYKDRERQILGETLPLDKSWSVKMLLEREKALKAEKKVKMLSYLLLSILLVLIVIVYFSYIKQKKSGTIIRHKNKIIQDALKTSKMLLKEMHHRVKNNLQLVSSIAYIEYEQNDEQFDFERFENRIISLSLIHRLLYSTEYTEHIECGAYLENLLSNLQNTADKPFEFVLNTDDLKLKSDQMISMGLLINELVINTVKHCHPIEDEDIVIHLNLHKEGERLKLIYTDNGTSYNVSNKTESYSLGQNLIDLLIQKLKGKSVLNFDTGYNLTVVMK